MRQDLGRDMNRDSMASCFSLAPEGGGSLNIAAAEKELQNSGRDGQEMEVYRGNSKKVLKDTGRPVLGQEQEECVSRSPGNGNISTTLQIQENRVALEGGGDTAVMVENGGEDEGSFQVSGLYLLSPEAQLLTQEILLETESVCSQSYSKNTSSDCPTGRSVNPTFVRSSDTNPALKSEIRVTFQNSFTETDPPMSGHQLSRQTARQQLTETTCTCNQGLATPKSWQLRSTNQLPAQAPRQGRKLSDIVGISRHHSTSVPTRPHSAAVPGRQTATVSHLPKGELLTRPKSAVENLHKTYSNENYRLDSTSDKSTIFVDLSKLHPLHVDN